MQLKAICQQNCEHILKFLLIMVIRIDNLHINRGKHAVTENRLAFEIVF